MSNSILPILTKTDPTDSDLDIELYKIELQEIMTENLKKYLRELQYGNESLEL